MKDMIASEPIHILLVEDNRHDSFLMRRTLKKSLPFCEVTWVPRGEEALRKIQTHTFDAVLIDFKMPGLSGLETFQELLKREESLPVIFVTGTGNEQVAVEALKLGAIDYLVKDTEGSYLELVPVVLRKALKQWEDKLARQRAEASLRQYTADLEARNAELDAFSRTVAHDLKAPLAIMLCFTELLEDYAYLLDAEGRSYLKHLLEYGHKMNDIIEALLLLAEVRKIDVKKEVLNMAVIVNEALKRLPEVEIMMPKRWPQAYGYGPWIEEVWANYLSNAVKYGGNPPQVELGTTISNGMVRFWVKDNGVGISPEDQAQLFTPFTHLHNTNGHGLGLSIVQRIIEKSDGEVGVESELGKGSTFWFTLPMRES